MNDLMPIQKPSFRSIGYPKNIPFSILNEEWAQKNHGQSLNKLASRGGLDTSEALAIIQCRSWYRMGEQESLDELLSLIVRKV